MGFLNIFKNKSSNIYRHGHRCYLDDQLTKAEIETIHLLASNLSHREYFIFNNLIIPSRFSITTQIDHVVASKFGIFIIENKDYSGWIYAHKNRKEWTQTTCFGRKYKLKNPLFQNFAHVSALKEQLPFVGKRVFNIVVFSRDAVFKTDKPDNVLYQDELVDYIRQQKNDQLKEVELLVVIGKLSMLCQTIEVTPKEHVQNIKNYLSSPTTPLPLNESGHKSSI